MRNACDCSDVLCSEIRAWQHNLPGKSIDDIYGSIHERYEAKNDFCKKVSTSFHGYVLDFVLSRCDAQTGMIPREQVIYAQTK